MPKLSIRAEYTQEDWAHMCGERMVSGKPPAPLVHNITQQLAEKMFADGLVKYVVEVVNDPRQYMQRVVVVTGSVIVGEEHVVTYDTHGWNTQEWSYK